MKAKIFYTLITSISLFVLSFMLFSFVSSDESGTDGCPTAPCPSGYTCANANVYFVNGQAQTICPSTTYINAKCCKK